MGGARLWVVNTGGAVRHRAAWIFFMAEGSGGILRVDCLLVAARMVWNVSWMGGGGGYSACGSTILN